MNDTVAWFPPVYSHYSLFKAIIMARKKRPYGWTYAKNGQVVTISQPTTADGKPVKHKTIPGGLPASVGFSRLGGNERPLAFRN